MYTKIGFALADGQPGDFGAGHGDVGHVGDHLEGIRDPFVTDHCVQTHAVDLALVPPGVHGDAYAGDGHGQVGGLDGGDGVHAIACEGHREAGDFFGRQALERGSKMQMPFVCTSAIPIGTYLPQMDFKLSTDLMWLLADMPLL